MIDSRPVKLAKSFIQTHTELQGKAHTLGEEKKKASLLTKKRPRLLMQHKNVALVVVVQELDVLFCLTLISSCKTSH